MRSALEKKLSYNLAEPELSEVRAVIGHVFLLEEKNSDLCLPVQGEMISVISLSVFVLRV